MVVRDLRTAHVHCQERTWREIPRPCGSVHGARRAWRDARCASPHGVESNGVRSPYGEIVWLSA
jgi:hypothetical protein